MEGIEQNFNNPEASMEELSREEKMEMAEMAVEGMFVEKMKEKGKIADIKKHGVVI